MAKPFDATTKDLLEIDPAAWMAYLGLHPQGTVEVIDSDLSTITAEADKVFRVVGPESYLVHVEVQSSSDPTLPRRLFRYNALLDYRHSARVWSVAVLLRPEADAASLTGNLQLRLPDGPIVHDFRYGVVRTWRQSTEAILQGPLNLLPMALLADAPPEAARSVVQRIDERLSQDATEPEAARLIKSTMLLGGLRFEQETLDQLFLGARNMNLLSPKILKDSSITPEHADELLRKMDALTQMSRRFDQIRVEEARSILSQIATARFGHPTKVQKAMLDAIADHDRLVELCEKVGSLSTWDELLASEIAP
jgi:predicted transposase YdaD